MKSPTYAISLVTALIACGATYKHKVSGKSEHEVSVDLKACDVFDSEEERKKCMQTLLKLLDKECEKKDDTPS